MTPACATASPSNWSASPCAARRGPARDVDQLSRLALNPRVARKADRMVIMIDPFAEASQGDVAHEDLMATAVIGSLAGARLNQARFKVAELVATADEDGAPAL